MAVLIENYIPVIKYEGLNTDKNAVIGGTLSVTGASAMGALTGTSISVTGSATAKSATAVPATAGAVAAGVPVSMYTEGVTIEVTSNAPTHTRPKGSICINTGGSSTSTRMYVNTDGAGTWTAFTTAA